MMQVVESIPLRRGPVDLGVLLELTLEALHLQARVLNVTLKVRIVDDVPAPLQIDGDKVAWAVANLVGTALRHVRRGTQRTQGGTIDVDARYDSTRSELVINVRDDGQGIPPERLVKLLNRGTRSHPGQALALLLVEDIAAAHGGGIEVESNADRVGHFTNVRLTIPAL
jgi:two-component system, sporulation sensor kinase E